MHINVEKSLENVSKARKTNTTITMNKHNYSLDEILEKRLIFCWKKYYNFLSLILFFPPVYGLQLKYWVLFVTLPLSEKKQYQVKQD